ncbi:MAG: stage III sporulation protein AE [Oscillospiraceae bacterium]|nr:stage III sporulation protein AE [Oscillospiraceae bacterium]
MKCLLKTIIYIIVLLLFMISPHAHAEDFGQDELSAALPEEARQILNENDITPDNAGALGLSPLTVLKGLWTVISDEIMKPLKMLAALTGVILLCAAAETLRAASESAGGAGRASDAFGLAGVLAGSGMMIMYISDTVARAVETLNTGGVFLLTFIPVFAGIMAVAGQITTASVFSISLITAAQVFTYVNSIILTPLAGCILGVSTAGAISPDLKVDALAGAIKKVVVWSLGLLVTLFTGLLSLQSFISSSADTLALRAMKFTVSSSVPFIGGAVGDALAAVRGSINLLRSSTGTFGIIAGLIIILPTLVSVFCHKIALGIAAAISDVFGLERLSSLLRSGEGVLGIIFALLICFALVAVVSVGLMLFMWNGGV